MSVCSCSGGGGARPPSSVRVCGRGDADDKALGFLELLVLVLFGYHFWGEARQVPRHARMRPALSGRATPSRQIKREKGSYFRSIYNIIDTLVFLVLRMPWSSWC
jgi:hypothetical protein